MSSTPPARVDERIVASVPDLARALRPDGVFLMVDIKASSKVEENMDMPWASYLYAISTFHCMSVSLGLDGDDAGEALDPVHQGELGRHRHRVDRRQRDRALDAEHPQRAERAGRDPGVTEGHDDLAVPGGVDR